MKYLIFTAVFFLSTTLHSQEVKLKKEIVFIDNVPTFSFDKKSMGNELYVYKLNTKDEIVKITTDNNKTESPVDDSKKITFTQQKTTVHSKDFRKQTFEFLISALITEKVIDLKGEVNADNLKRFWSKYDQNNINHTNMH